MGDDNVEDDSATDEFLSSRGFEFVNASSYHTVGNQDRNDSLSSDDEYNVGYSDTHSSRHSPPSTCD